MRPSDKSVPPTLLSCVYSNKHHQLCWAFLEGRWVGFSSLNFKHLIWLVLRYLFNEWMEGSIVRECLQYDEGSSTQCLFLCTHYIESLDSWLAYKCLKMRGFSHLSRYNRICWILEALWWLWSDNKCLKMSPLGWVIATMQDLNFNLKTVYKTFLNFSLGLEWVRPKAATDPQDKKVFQHLYNQRKKPAFFRSLL